MEKTLPMQTPVSGRPRDTMLDSLFGALVLIASMTVLIETAGMVYELGYFRDEMQIVQCAFNFFTSGNYSPGEGIEKVPAKMSTGIGGTWPSGLAFALGGELLAARIAAGAVFLVQAVVLLAMFFRQWGARLGVAIGLAICTWAFSQKVPYWYGYIHSLGELSGALWILAGTLLLKRSVTGAALCFGVAVWLCKFIYFPCAAVFALAYFISIRAYPWNEPKVYMKSISAFLAPLAIWLAIAWIRFDTATVMAWLYDFTAFVRDGNAASTSPVPAFHMKERLTSSLLEWSGYRNQDRVKILFFTLGAMAFGAVMWSRFRTRASRLESALHWGATLLIGLFTVWYFCLHPSMFLRHLLPAMYLGFSMIVYWVVRAGFAMRPSRRQQAAVLLLLIGFFSLQLRKTVIGRVNRIPPSYVHECKDLLSEACMPRTVPYAY